MDDRIIKIISKVAPFILIILLLLASFLFIPHSKEYNGWQNTLKACDEIGGCVCSATASGAVQEYKKKHNLTFDEFPVYIISDDELPPIW